MRKTITILLFSFCHIISAQEASQTTELLNLAEIYKKNHVIEPTEEVFQKLGFIKSDDLQGAKEFIGELILDNNSIATTKYLTKPDSSTLQNLYLVKMLTWNMFKGKSEDESYGLDTLLKQKIVYSEQLANYYSMLFSSVLNKNRPFNMEEINFDISQYDLNSAEERGVFFLESMETFGTLISGYFYIDPPNYIKAMDFISKYPKYNGKPYYEYLELEFEDFMFTFSSKKPKGSYKKYQLNKFMNTILSHAICLSQEVEDREKMNEILLNSILKNEEYWKFSDSPETFKQIYHK